MKFCKATKENGEPCRSHAVRSTGYCFFHDPSVTPEQRREVARKGGKVKKYTALVKRDFAESLVTDSKQVLIETINQLRAGEMPPNVGNSIIYATATLHKIYESEEIENRLMELEKIIGGRRV